MDRVIAAKVFVDVAHSGSFTATAERLDMSRSMVTRYIEAMESWLQTRLLHRSTRKIALTSAGERCLARIEDWLAQGEEIEQLTLKEDTLSGLVRIATSMSFGFSQLVTALKPFLALHPDVHLDLNLSDSVTDLVEQRIDLAIRITSNPDPSLIGLPIAVCDSVLVAAPSYLAKSAEIEQIQQLSQHTCLGFVNFKHNVWHFSQKEQFESVEVHCQLTSNEAMVLLHGALAGMGISLLPAYLVNKHIEEGELKPILPQWQPNNLTIYALYSSRKHLSPAIRALIDHLRDYFSTQRW